MIDSDPAGADRPTVVVVGGGLSGIAAALGCARGGASVTLVESRARLGGAAYSFDRHGVHADNGQHVFLRCCTAYRELLDELDAGSMVTLQPRLDIPILAPGGRRARLRRSGLPAPLHLAGALARYSLLSLAERFSLVRAMRALGRIDVDDPQADARSFGDWLAEHGQGAGAVEAIWELICRPTVNLTVADASLAQAAQVFQVGLLSDTAGGDVGYATVPLSDIHDQAAARALARAGVEVRLRTGAARVSAEGDGLRVELSGGSALHAGAVVVATSPQRTAALLPPEAGISRTSLDSLGSSSIVNLHVLFDRPVLDEAFAAGVYTPVQWIFDRTRSAGVEEGQYLAVTLSAADEELGMTAEDLRARYLPALNELLPAARTARVNQFFVTREHAATFRAGPGARFNRPGPRTRVPGLVVAGTWTDTGWPATMESAVRSGRAAASEALAWLGQRARHGDQRLKEVV
ncbi:MAG TPA: hydroxysqualene dehydroxylase HpnE [Solirubrobacteraceae bacterium]|jgi:squalene-associated FAD-dependent desaturase|nr:hydroxysqualene dehydroxylase HpnE [Solirubrobacteraceae bacterium]